MESKRDVWKDWRNKVVPISKTSSILLSDTRAALARVAQQAEGRNDAVEAAGAWLLPGLDTVSRLATMAEHAAACKGQMRSYKQVAVLGYAASLLLDKFQQQAALENGLKWLSGLPAMSAGALMGFATDPVSLLGIALGTRCACDEVKSAVRNWASKFLSDEYNALGTEPWHSCLLAVTAQILTIEPVLPIPIEAEAACVRVAMRSKGLLPANSSNETDEEFVLTLLKESRVTETDCTHAAIQMVALDWIRRKAPTVIPARMTPEDVVSLLKHTEFALKRWTWEDRPKTTTGIARQWHIDNEYHLQNLLWTLLAPIFPDLTDEEYTIQLGSKNPRIDLGIPSLKLIIEAKFMRMGDPPKKFIEEIAADASLYLVEGARYNQIVAIIWDDTARTNLHTEMIRAMNQIDGVLDAIVVSRPGNWT